MDRARGRRETEIVGVLIPWLRALGISFTIHAGDQQPNNALTPMHDRSQDAPTQWEVGKRYLHGKNGRPLTLRYIGTLPPNGAGSSQIWLGIEYDDPAYGKHSGQFEGVPVFRTETDGAGAFVKANSEALKRGPTFVEAFEERYGLIIPHSGANQQGPKHTISQVSLGDSGIVVEAPGMQDVQQRIGRLEKLREISLVDEGVSSLAGSEDQRQGLKSRLRGKSYLPLIRRS
jgi:hypothetical protein